MKYSTDGTPTHLHHTNIIIISWHHDFLLVCITQYQSTMATTANGERNYPNLAPCRVVIRNPNGIEMPPIRMPLEVLSYVSHLKKNALVPPYDFAIGTSSPRCALGGVGEDRFLPVCSLPCLVRSISDSDVLLATGNTPEPSLTHTR